ncbi:tetratricopeptide repeat protein [Conchiformibius kuhniae]|uniref:Tetratricopeptide repeat protein n=1 Tax=Conchiformibius kuhniae TaxID=211502 RepID=A0A8T9MS82_9NEIS|nr:tetratricopeptide repeat protein [Conchiformibius kuhniae]UOP04131.1 sel1 repeat family protein [Conchiformibius kuhniae]
MKQTFYPLFVGACLCAAVLPDFAYGKPNCVTLSDPSYSKPYVLAMPNSDKGSDEWCDVSRYADKNHADLHRALRHNTRYSGKAARLIQAEAEKMAEQGDRELQTWMGKRYWRNRTDGSTPESDRHQAYRWFAKAAAQNHGVAQVYLARMYLHGTGAPRDGEKAVYWLNRALQHQDGDVSFEISKLYGKDLSDAGDCPLGCRPQKEQQWRLLAAAQGSAAAQFALGIHYAYAGELLPPNGGQNYAYAKAHYWLAQATTCSQHPITPAAAYALGEMHETGKSVLPPKDPAAKSLARAWYARALAGGYRPAEEKLKNLD